MRHTPNFARMNIKVILAFVVLAFFQSLALSAETVHHYVINKTTAPVVGEECTISISAHREDGSLIPTAKNKFKFYMSSRKGLETKDLQLKSGETKISMTFKSADNIILQVVDKNNSELSSSELMQVTVAHQTKNRGGR